MSSDERLIDLLLRCEELREQGQPIDLEALCHDNDSNSSGEGAHVSTATLQQFQAWLDQANEGDVTARERLLEHVAGRLLCLARRLWAASPMLNGLQDTSASLVSAQARLRSALAEQQPRHLGELFHLSAGLIRRELIDLARPDVHPNDNGPPGLPAQPGVASSLRKLHEHVDGLPEEEREAVDLLYYHELTQEQAAEVTGASRATMKRRWASARLRLGNLLHTES